MDVFTIPKFDTNSYLNIIPSELVKLLYDYVYNSLYRVEIVDDTKRYNNQTIVLVITYYSAPSIIVRIPFNIHMDNMYIFDKFIENVYCDISNYYNTGYITLQYTKGRDIPRHITTSASDSNAILTQITNIQICPNLVKAIHNIYIILHNN